MHELLLVLKLRHILVPIFVVDSLPGVLNDCLRPQYCLRSSAIFAFPETDTRGYHEGTPQIVGQTSLVLIL